jgi:glycosyltransferase involved in cell wall biosynthesis
MSMNSSITDEPLRIVHCFRSPVGGIFRHVRDLVEAQVKAGHQVGIVCDSSTGGAFEDKLFDLVKPKLSLGLHRVAMKRHIGPGDIIAAWQTYKTIKKLNPDILHGHGAKGGAYARLFGSVLRVFRSRVARLYSLHGGSLHYSDNILSGKLFFMIERLLGLLTDHLLFVAEFERMAYAAKIGDASNGTVIYNGLREEEFDDVVTKPDAADFLFIGMMRDLKGPDLFIDALREASSTVGRPLTAVMVGAGDDLPSYKRSVEHRGLSSRVKFYDPMPARQAFAMAKCVVVSSRAEAMPYIVLEALAAGKPLIATRVGGIPEILGTKSIGLCDISAHAIAEKMHLFALAPVELIDGMPKKADLKLRFGADVMAAQIEAQYRAALGEEFA